MNSFTIISYLCTTINYVEKTIVENYELRVSFD